MVVGEFVRPDVFRIAWHTPSGQPFEWFYSLVWFVFGMLLLGTVTRLLREASPTLWRPVMLCVGAGLALAQRWIIEITVGTPISADTWLAAVLGLAVAAVLARVLPGPFLSRWYGVKK